MNSVGSHLKVVYSRDAADRRRERLTRFCLSSLRWLRDVLATEQWRKPEFAARGAVT